MKLGKFGDRSSFPNLIFFLAVFATGACAVRENNQSALPYTTTVCELRSYPEKFNQKIVRIPGYVSSDGYHITLLKDRACTAGILLDMSNESRNEDIKRLSNANFFELPVGAGDDVGKQITGLFTGLFRWNPDPDHFEASLLIESISNLQITKRDPR